MSFELIVIGTSLGGLHALEKLLPVLPLQFPVALAIAQHRYRESDGELVAHLQRQTRLPLMEVEDKQPIVAGHIYLAPADYHLLVEPGHFALSADVPVLHARPSIDVLFESAAEAYRDRTIGIVLTGASRDGAQGLAQIKAYGGVAIVQDPKTAESPTLPLASLAIVPDAKVLPLDQIAPFLIHLCLPYFSTSVAP
jgi:two-component system, chemotaxis family, protein-glutamate methylesterase/glutaminase